MTTGLLTKCVDVDKCCRSSHCLIDYLIVYILSRTDSNDSCIGQHTAQRIPFDVRIFIGDFSLINDHCLETICFPVFNE